MRCGSDDVTETTRGNALCDSMIERTKQLAAGKCPDILAPLDVQRRTIDVWMLANAF